MYQKGNEESKLAKVYEKYREPSERESIRNIGKQFGMVARLWEAIEEYFERPEETEVK